MPYDRATSFIRLLVELCAVAPIIAVGMLSDAVVAAPADAGEVVVCEPPRQDKAAESKIISDLASIRKKLERLTKIEGALTKEARSHLNSTIEASRLRLGVSLTRVRALILSAISATAFERDFDLAGSHLDEASKVLGCLEQEHDAARLGLEVLEQRMYLAFYKGETRNGTELAMKIVTAFRTQRADANRDMDILERAIAAGLEFVADDRLVQIAEYMQREISFRSHMTTLLQPDSKWPLDSAARARLRSFIPAWIDEIRGSLPDAEAFAQYPTPEVVRRLAESRERQLKLLDQLGEERRLLKFGFITTALTEAISYRMQSDEPEKNKANFAFLDRLVGFVLNQWSPALAGNAEVLLTAELLRVQALLDAGDLPEARKAFQTGAEELTGKLQSVGRSITSPHLLLAWQVGTRLESETAPATARMLARKMKELRRSIDDRRYGAGLDETPAPPLFADGYRGFLESALWALLGESGKDVVTGADAEEALDLVLTGPHGTTEISIRETAARLADSTNPLSPQIRQLRMAEDRLFAFTQLQARQASQAITRPGTKDSAAALESDRQVEDVRRERDRLLAEIRSKAPRYEALLRRRHAPIAVYRRVLRDDELVLIPIVGEKHSFVITLTSGGVKAIAVATGNAEVQASVEKVRAGLFNPAIKNSAKLNFDPKPAYDLYALFFERILAAVPGNTKILFVADGPFTALPPQVLLTKPLGSRLVLLSDWQSAHFFGQERAISVLPSLRSLLDLGVAEKTSRADRGVFGVGDTILPRPGVLRPELGTISETASELNEIARSLGSDDSQILLGPLATKQALLAAELRRYRILAFAGHAFLAGEARSDESEPSLLLSPPPGKSDADVQANDVLMRGSEVAALDLDAELVILSACNTAGAERKTAKEQLTGLARAFILAGAREVLVSHWPVNSIATAPLVKAFVANRQAGASSSEALRQATADMVKDRQHPIFAHPSMWAPFVLVGLGR